MHVRTCMLPTTQYMCNTQTKGTRVETKERQREERERIERKEQLLSSRGTVQLRRSVNGQRQLKVGRERYPPSREKRRNADWAWQRGSRRATYVTRMVPEYHYVQLLYGDIQRPDGTCRCTCVRRKNELTLALPVGCRCVTRLFASSRQPRQPPRIPQHSGTRKSPSLSLSLSLERARAFALFHERGKTLPGPYQGRWEIAIIHIGTDWRRRIIEKEGRSLIDSKEETFLRTSV